MDQLKHDPAPFFPDLTSLASKRRSTLRASPSSPHDNEKSYFSERGWVRAHGLKKELFMSVYGITGPQIHLTASTSQAITRPQTQR